MRPFLFLSARAEVEAVGPEYESVRRAMGVDASRLEHHPLLFTCYGIGVLTRVLGGHVGTLHGEQAGAVEITLTVEGRADALAGVLPEVSARDFVARAQVHRHHGYFPAGELRAVSERLAAASVTEPQRMLRRFVDLADA